MKEYCCLKINSCITNAGIKKMNKELADCELASLFTDVKCKCV